MRALKGIYPEYQDQVAFVAVDVDPSEDAELIRRYADQNEYPWEMALYDSSIVVDYRITSQASKVAIGADGVITYRGGYGSLGGDEWRKIFGALTTG